MNRRDPAAVPAGVTTPEPTAPAADPFADAPPGDDRFAPLTGAGGCGRAFETAFAAVWTLGWVVGLSAAAVAMAPDYWLAVRSDRFAEAPGRVIDCRVQVDQDGPTYSLDLAYAYRVGGRNFIGTRYDANSLWITDDAAAWYERTADALPPDATVTVYYDPADPATSLLAPGVTGRHLLFLVGLGPFAAFALLGGRFLWGRVPGRRSGRGEAAAPRVRTDGRLIRVPLATFSPFAAAVIGAGGVCVLGAFVVGFGLGFGFRPPVWAPAAVLLTAAGLAAATPLGGCAALRFLSQSDLLIDRDRQLLTLPRVSGAATRLTVPFAAVERVGVDEFACCEGRTYAAAVFLTAAAAKGLGVHRTQALTRYTGPSPRCRARDGLVEWLRTELDRPAG